MLRDHKEILEFGFKYSMEDPIAYDIMCRKLQYRDGHYQLPLLWRNDAVKLPQSLGVALKRLDSLKRRLKKDLILHSRYSEQMQTMIDRGYAERVPDHELQPPPRQWYIPHQPVLSAKKPDMVRVVYDCSSVSGDKSLHDFFMKEPDLMNSLVGVLLRFRKAPIAVTADIEAMLCQVRVAPSDKDALRFYWWPNGDLDRIPEIYRMTVHLFGAKSSPSCATFCLRQTAEKFGKYCDPCVAAIVLNNFYVDDCLFSIETEEVAISIVNNLRSLLLKGGFKLTKRLSTSSQVMQAIPDEEKSKSVRNAIPPSVPLSCQPILGVSWDVKTDEFCVSVELPKLPCTKRGILSVTNSLYDPLGFVTPVVLNARLVYSEACIEKLGWDEDVQGKLLSRWLSWVEGLPRLQNVRIKRHCRIDSAQNQLHFFLTPLMWPAALYVMCVLFFQTRLWFATL